LVQKERLGIKKILNVKNSYLIFILCISLILPVGEIRAQTSQGKNQIIFEDHFNDDKKNWGIADTSYIRTDVRNGKYLIENKNKHVEYLVSHSLNISDKEDFVIDASIESIHATEDPHYGIFWGSFDQVGYKFKILNDGYFSLEKVKERKVSEIMKRNKAVDNWDFKNRLKIVKQGNTMQFYANDIYMDEIKDAPFMGNEIGFIVGGKQAIAVDYIRVSKIGPEKRYIDKKLQESREKALAEKIEKQAGDTKEETEKREEPEKKWDKTDIALVLPEKTDTDKEFTELGAGSVVEHVEPPVEDISGNNKREHPKEEVKISEREAKDQNFKSSRHQENNSFDALEEASEMPLPKKEILHPTRMFQFDEFTSIRSENGLKNLEPHSLVLIDAGIAASREQRREEAIFLFEKAKELSPDLPLPYLYLAKNNFSFTKEGLTKTSGYIMDLEKAFLNNFWWSFQIIGMLSLNVFAAFCLTFFLFIMILLSSKLKLFVHDVIEDKKKMLLLLPPLILVFFGPVFGVVGFIFPFWLYLHKRAKSIIFISLLIMVFMLFAFPWIFSLPGVLSDRTVSGVVKIHEGKLSGDIAEISGEDNTYEASFAHALDLKRKGRYREAVNIYKTLLGQRKDSRVYNNLANCFVGLSEYDNAIALYNKAINTQELPSAYYNLSQVYRETFQFRKADKYYLKAVEIDPLKVSSYSKTRGASINRLVVDETFGNKELWSFALKRSTYYVSLNSLSRILSFTDRKVSIVLLCLLVFLLSVQGKIISSGAYRCLRCGKIYCRKCEKKISYENVCHMCSKILVKRGQLTLQERVEKILEAHSYKRKKYRILKILTLIFPGGGHVFHGWCADGFLIMLAFTFFVLSFIL
jgi:tetratricopeptide (TPR) repeat protein